MAPITKHVVSALLQAAQRRNLLDRAMATAWAHDLAAIDDDPGALRQRILARSASLPKAEALADLLSGEKAPHLGGWIFLVRLGQGAFGATWAARREGEASLCACKALDRLSAEALDPDALVQSSQHLDQHYLVPTLEWHRDDCGRVCLIRPWVHGRSLAERQALKGPPAEARALTIMRQVAKGLAYLGRERIVHGCLHPDNILLDPRGRAHLTDFGLMVAPGSLVPRAGCLPAALGLHAWSAPEALADEAKPGVASDIYAVGCILYWMLGGEHPFPGRPEAQVLQHRGAPRPDVRRLNPTVSERTAKTIAKAMAINPVDRYLNAEQLLGALERNRAGLGGRASDGEADDGDQLGGNTPSTIMPPGSKPVPPPPSVPAEASDGAVRVEEKAQRKADELRLED